MVWAAADEQIVMVEEALMAEMARLSLVREAEEVGRWVHLQE